MTYETLIAHYRAGDSRAANEIIRRMTPLVWTLTRPYFAPGAEREDLVQEGLIGLVEAMQRFEPERGRFLAFAYGCIRCRILDFVTRSRRRKYAALNEAAGIEALAETPTDRDRPDVVLAGKLELAAIGERLSGLSPLERAAVQLRAIGYTQRDSARQLKCGRKTVDNALLRAKKKLSCLREEVRI